MNQGKQTERFCGLSLGSRRQPKNKRPKHDDTEADGSAAEVEGVVSAAPWGMEEAENLATAMKGRRSEGRRY